MTAKRRFLSLWVRLTNRGVAPMPNKKPKQICTRCQQPVEPHHDFIRGQQAGACIVMHWSSWIRPLREQDRCTAEAVENIAR
jgi:hypothetical protein